MATKFGLYGGFDLRIWFFLVSALAILVTHSGIALVLNSYVKDSIVMREADVSREFLNSIITAENSSETLFAAPYPSPSLVSFYTHIQNLPGMERFNVYSADRYFRYSSDPGLIGKRAMTNEELTEALGNQIIARLEDVDDNENTDLTPKNKIEGKSLIEAYLPIAGTNGKVIGVVEFYKLPGAVVSVLAVISVIIWGAAGISGLILFGALSGAVARGARIIENQNHLIGDMAASAALGQMASAVAHSLRNPLAGIRSSAELLRHQYPELAAEAANDIQNEVERMNQHIRQLLDYSSAGANKLTPTNFTVLVTDLLAKTKSTLDRQKINLVINVDIKATCLVALDTPLFGQVVASILVNAVEAMPHGGTLTVSLTTLKGKAQVEFHDTGTGIEKELLSKLPQPFLTSKAKGLGLGLSLALRIVEKMSGEMTLASEVGKGTSVFLSFPISVE